MTMIYIYQWLCHITTIDQGGGQFPGRSPNRNRPRLLDDALDQDRLVDVMILAGFKGNGNRTIEDKERSVANLLARIGTDFSNRCSRNRRHCWVTTDRVSIGLEQAAAGIDFEVTHRDPAGKHAGLVRDQVPQSSPDAVLESRTC